MSLQVDHTLLLQEVTGMLYRTVSSNGTNDCGDGVLNLFLPCRGACICCGVVNFVIRAGRTGRRLWGSLQGFLLEGLLGLFFGGRTLKS